MSAVETDEDGSCAAGGATARTRQDMFGSCCGSRGPEVAAARLSRKREGHVEGDHFDVEYVGCGQDVAVELGLVVVCGYVCLRRRVRCIVCFSEVVVNGEQVKLQVPVACSAGDCLELQVSVSNSLECVLRQVTLSIQFYQDYQNGTLNYKLDSRLATAGATKYVSNRIKLNFKCFFVFRVLLPDLNAQEETRHTCNVIFFTPGQYKVDIQCSMPENANATPSLGHVWKFIPAVDITVN